MTLGSLPPLSRLIEETLIPAPEYSAEDQAHTLARWWQKVRCWSPGRPLLHEEEICDYFPKLPKAEITQNNNLQSPKTPRLILKGVKTSKQIRTFAQHAFAESDGEQEAHKPTFLPDRKKTLYLAGHLEVATGEVVFQCEDFSFPGPVNFQWQRTYRSGSEEDFGFGAGWFHTLCERIWIKPSKVEGEKNFIEYLGADGRYLRFAQPAIGEACINRTEGLVLHRQGQMSYRLVAFDKPDRIFRADGANAWFPLVEIRDAIDNILSIDYQNGLPKKIVSSWGRVIEFSSEEQRIVKIINPSAPEKQAPLASYSFVDEQLAQSIDAFGRPESFLYSKEGKLEQRQTPSGSRYVFHWNSQFERYEGVTEGELKHGVIWRNTLLRADITNGLGAESAARFDEKNRLVWFRDSEGNEQKWFYDGYGNLCSQTNALGHTRYYRWDSLNRCVRETDYAGHSIHYRYDSWGNPAQIDGELGLQWQREYNDVGQLLAERDPVGGIWRYVYSERQMLEFIIDPEGGKTRFQWSSQGELESITSQEGQVTTLEYDPSGRLNSVSRAGERLLKYEFSANNLLSKAELLGGENWRFHHDNLGRLVALEVIDGFAATCEYDDFGRVAVSRISNIDEYSFSYDVAGNRVGVSSNTRRITYEYNSLGWLMGLKNAEGREQQFEYNAVGSLVQHRDMAVITYIERDELGHAVKISNNSGENRQFHYDELSRLVFAQNQFSVVRFQYDLCGNLKAEHQENEPGGSHSFLFNYDSRGWRIKCTADDLLIGYLHTPDGRLRGMDLNGASVLRCAYDDFGRDSHWVQGEVKTRFSWTNQQIAGVDCEKKGQELVFKQSFSPKQVEYLPMSLGLSAPVLSKSLSKVDERGNLRCEPNTAAGGDGLCYYYYNGWNQLVSAECDEFKTFYRYDPFGRRISKQTTHRKSKHARQTVYCWFGNKLWSEQHSTHKGVEQFYYLRHPYSAALVSMTKEETTFNFLNTPSLQPLRIFTANGEAVWYAKYDKNGSFAGLEAKPRISNPWREVNYYYDSETQLYCDGYGYYSPKLGHGLTE